MGDDSGLPGSFEMAWGVRDRPTKGPKRGLSLEQVVDAAVRVADAEGIAGVSMNRVAKELGTSAMSLYRYVASKDELLALMVDGAFGRIEVDEPVDGTWRERLARWARIELVGYRTYPWMLRIPVSGPPVLPNQLRMMEWGLRAVGDTALEEHEKLSVVLLVTSFTRSFAMLSSDIAAAFETGDSAANVLTNYGRLVTGLTAAADFPALHAVAAAGAFDDGDEVFDELDYDFEFGLDRILDGVGVLVARRE